MSEAAAATELFGQNLLVTGLGLFALFCIGIVTTTVLQEFVRARIRNGKGNLRIGDEGWPSKMLKDIGAMNENLRRIEKSLTNDLPHTLEQIVQKLDRLSNK